MIRLQQTKTPIPIPRFRFMANKCFHESNFHNGISSRSGNAGARFSSRFASAGGRVLSAHGADYLGCNESDSTESDDLQSDPAAVLQYCHFQSVENGILQAGDDEIIIE